MLRRLKSLTEAFIATCTEREDTKEAVPEVSIEMCVGTCAEGEWVNVPEALTEMCVGTCAEGEWVDVPEAPTESRVARCAPRMRRGRAGGTAVVDNPGQRPGTGHPTLYSPGGASCGENFLHIALLCLFLPL